MIPSAPFNLAAFYQAAARDALDRLAAARRREAAIIAELARWQHDAQTDEERAWANAYSASITRALTEAT